MDLTPSVTNRHNVHSDTFFTTKTFVLNRLNKRISHISRDHVHRQLNKWSTFLQFSQEIFPFSFQSECVASYYHIWRTRHFRYRR